MNRPWFQMYSRDWLDNKELRRCSPPARSILIDLMCLAHEGIPYGHLADKVGPLTIKYCASRCLVTVGQFMKAMGELQLHGRVGEKDGVLFIPRMVADEDLRLRRACGGKESIGHPHTHPPKQKEGYPSDHPSLKNDSRACAPADCDSDSSVGVEVINKPFRILPKNPDAPDWEEIDAAWKWYQLEYPSEVNSFVEAQLFISVMETRQDLADLKVNLPLWKLNRRWIDGFAPASKNFLSERVFKVTPKSRDSPNGKQRNRQQESLDQWDQL